MALDAMILVFLMLSLQPAFSLSPLTLVLLLTPTDATEFTLTSGDQNAGDPQGQVNSPTPATGPCVHTDKSQPLHPTLDSIKRPSVGGRTYL